MLLLPKQRSAESGAKKRYAGLRIKKDKEYIDVTGMELVRRDWTDLAKEFQKGLLNRIFHKEEFEQYVKKFIKDLKNGKKDSLLVYKKALRKPLDQYTKTTPPHVKAARKLKKISSNLIHYYITINGTEPIENKISEIDYEHYLNKQIKPIADSILTFYDRSFDDILDGNNQTSLSSFT